MQFSERAYGRRYNRPLLLLHKLPHRLLPMDTRKEVLAVLDETLSLKGRALGFADETPLLGAIPELDSMAVVAVLTGLEERFGIGVDDDDIDGSTFATVGALVSFVTGKLAH